MGRPEPSRGLAPSSIRKEQRAKQAKLTLSKTIPALLASDARARKGVESAELIVEPSSKPHDASKRTSGKKRSRRGSKDATGALEAETPTSASPAAVPEKSAKADLQVRIEVTDTLSAAQTLHQASPRSKRNVAILNMASPLRPGGGVRQGATSQEEHLCSRTTLLPSLREEWYRLPDVGGIWSPDVLVFRVRDGDLDKPQRFYVDVVSAGMMRFPEVQDGAYARDADRELCMRQVKGVVEILRQKGCERAVLGAWGCGAYANPVTEVARAFRKALENSAMREVVFAITEPAMAAAFAAAWGDDIEPIMVTKQRKADGDGDEHELQRRNELQAKIAELEAQIGQTKFHSVKERLISILQGLKAQAEEGTEAVEPDSDDEESGTGDNASSN